MAKKDLTKVQESFGDKVLLAFTTFVLFMICIIVGYPMVYVISSSFSSNTAISMGRVWLWPVDFSLAGYEFVLHFEDVWIGYRNTIFYTVTSTSLTMILQTLMAFPLSKRNYQGRGFVTKVMVVAMLTGAGLVPSFLLRVSLGMNNTVWAVILAGLVGTSNVFILRTSFRTSIPGELFDAAKIDGANEFQSLVKIGVPLAKATLAVLTLYASVGCWNDYFNAMIYLSTREDLWPLQLFLRNIMMGAELQLDPKVHGDTGTEAVRFCLIIVATVPVLAMYLVVQKYFEKGVMIGSVKG